MRRFDCVSEGDADEFHYSRVLSVLPPPQPRRSFHRSGSSISLALSFMSSRKSFSYDKLAQVPIQLTVVKLDGSSFEIDVTKYATIADLREAVEKFFGHLPAGSGKISWQHVWGHFCLSYGGKKLLNDSDTIKDYGIKDGDKLHFIQHVSFTNTLTKKRSRKWINIPKPCTSPQMERPQLDEVHGDLENLKSQQFKKEVEDNSTHNESMLCRLFGGWFLYSRLSSMEQLKYEGSGCTTRWAGGLVGCFRSLFHFCDNKPPSYSSRVSRVEI